MIQDFQANRQQKWSAALRLPLGGKLCHVVAVMRGSYINEKQNFSEENSRYAAERISRNSLG